MCNNNMLTAHARAHVRILRSQLGFKRCGGQLVPCHTRGTRRHDDNVESRGGVDGRRPSGRLAFCVRASNYGVYVCFCNVMYEQFVLMRNGVLVAPSVGFIVLVLFVPTITKK